MSQAERAIQSVAIAVILGFVTAATWWWRSTIFHAKRIEIRDQGWDRAKEEYPLITELPVLPTLSTETVEAVIRANTFSAQRRLKPPSTGAEAAGGGGELLVPPKAKFLFKGRINLGKRQRAIVEEAVTHKTYFLEVGQEVAGFKVLDIAENQVVLSDLQTHEEVIVSLAAPAAP